MIVVIVIIDFTVTRVVLTHTHLRNYSMINKIKIECIRCPYSRVRDATL